MIAHSAGFIQVSLSWEVQVLQPWLLSSGCCSQTGCAGAAPEEFSLLHHTSFNLLGSVLVAFGEVGMWLQTPPLWQFEFQISFCLFLDSGVWIEGCRDFMVIPTNIFDKSCWWGSKCWLKVSISMCKPLSLFALPDISLSRKSDVFWRLSDPGGSEHTEADLEERIFCSEKTSCSCPWS